MNAANGDDPTGARARFHVVGGFLGAGKTTALLRLAAGFRAQGRRVALITNDQAEGLVDSGAVRAAGFAFGEVAGACFCCKFDDLVAAAERLARDERPEILIGEPVGSCTDLAATVVQPLRRMYGGSFALAPYSVLVDPARVAQIILGRGFGGFSHDVAYIFRKQLEEADVIGLNKVDLLAPARQDELIGALQSAFPQARVIGVSGLTGAGFERWHAELAADRPAGEQIAEVDYDVYAAGEAELGWLNLTLDVAAASPFRLEALARDTVAALRAETVAQGCEAAHVKALAEAGDAAAVANFVGAGSDVRVSRPSPATARAARLTLNARVHVAPEALEAMAGRALARTLALHGVTARPVARAAFRPGRPVPIHRFARGEA